MSNSISQLVRLLLARLGMCCPAVMINFVMINFVMINFVLTFHHFNPFTMATGERLSSFSFLISLKVLALPD